MKVLIIGGTGILSTDVVQLCVNKAMEVTCINRGNHRELQNTGVCLIKADVRNKEELEQKLSGQNFDVIIDFLSYTLDELKLKLSIFNNRCTQYIFISSATVYQKSSEDEIITERTPLGNQHWDYGKNKILCEEFLKDNYDKTGQKYTIIRPYVTYGNTRIPYAVIPNHQPWSFVNRILNGKPIILWDSGKAVCTLTHTLDFSVGVVGLFKNEKAYGEAFHITSDQHQPWAEALKYILEAIGEKATVLDMSSEFISSCLPEYYGILYGDKGTNMVFSNDKIKDAVPEFQCKILFKDGIQKTVDYLKANPFTHTIDFSWDGRIDKLVIAYYRKNKIKYNRRLFRCVCADRKPTFKEKVKYWCSRYDFLFYFSLKLLNALKKVFGSIKK